MHDQRRVQSKRDARHIDGVAGVRAGAGDDGADDHEHDGGGGQRQARMHGVRRSDQRRARPGSPRAVPGERRSWSSSPIASTKCRATTHGFSLTSTVMPPATALTTTSQNCDQASRVSVRLAACLQARGDDRPADRDDQQTGDRRLVNSTIPWMPSAGIGVSESVVAGRPGRAAEAGAGDPHDAPADHDQDAHDQSDAVVPQRSARGPSVTRWASQPNGVCTLSGARIRTGSAGAAAGRVRPRGTAASGR